MRQRCHDMGYGFVLYCWLVLTGFSSLRGAETQDQPGFQDLLPSWQEQRIHGKPFFYSLQPECWRDGFRPLSEDAAGGRKLSETSLGQGNGSTLLNPSWNFPTPTRNPQQLQSYIPNLKDLCFRQIRIFDEQGRNLAPQAALYSESLGGGLQNLSALTDENPETACRSFYPLINLPHTGFVSFTFPENQRICKVEILHGRPNGAALVSLAVEFRLQYSKGGNWLDIPGSHRRENSQPETTHEFPLLDTAALRILVENQSDLYDYRNFPFSMENRWLNRVLNEKMFTPGQPFYWWYLGHTGDLFFGFPKDPVVDLNGFQKWHEKFPDFFGFGLLEWDNDILKSFLPMGRGFDPKYEFVIEQNGRPLTKAYLRACQTRVVERSFPQEYARDRNELLQQMQDEFRYQNLVLFDQAFMMLSHTTWYHYSLEWGSRLFMLESTGGTPNRQLQFAFARGISRQYQKPWGVYYAYFLGGGYLDYLNPPKKVDAHYSRGPDCGISASSHRRQLFLGYLSGAAFFDFEHQDIVPFVRSQDGTFQFSPHGQAMLEVRDFSVRHAERGVPFTPVGLLLDYAHGWTFWNDSNKVFMGFFPSNRSDLMIDRFLYEIFPWNKTSFEEGQGYCMTNTPYGNIFDVVIPNPPSGCIRAEQLKNYRVLMLLGDLQMNEQLAEQLRLYVAAGGTLLLNATQLNEHFSQEFTGIILSGSESRGDFSRWLPDQRIVNNHAMPYHYRDAQLHSAQSLLADNLNHPLLTVNEYGKGKVLVSLQNYLLGDGNDNPALPELQAVVQEVSRRAALPFTVQGDIEFSINRRHNGWWLALLNNKGIHKKGTEAASTDPAATATIHIQYDGNAESIRELITDRLIQFSRQNGKTSWQMQIPPGQIDILEIQTDTAK